MKISRKNSSTILLRDDKDDVIGTIHYRILSNKELLLPLQLECISPTVVQAHFNGASLKDVFLNDEGGMLQIQRSWRVHSEAYWKFSFLFQPAEICKDFIVPSVIYQNNKYGKGHFPKGGLESGWSFREDRTPLPSCSLLYSERHYYALYSSPAQRESELGSIKTALHQNRAALEFLFPYTESPRSFKDKGLLWSGLKSQEEQFLYLRQENLPMEISRDFFLLYGEANHPAEAFPPLWKKNIHQEKLSKRYEKAPWSRIVSYKLQHLRHLLVDRKEKDLCCLRMGSGNWLFQPFYNFTAGSFLIKSLEGAYIFARAGQELDKPELIDIACRMGDFFLGGALPNGLHQDMIHIYRRKWGGYLGIGSSRHLHQAVNARCNGEVMINYLKLHFFLKQLGIEKPEFLELPLKNAAFYIDNQLRGNYDGCFGRWRQKDGSPIDSAGTNGAYILSLLLEIKKQGLDLPGMDNALLRAADYYARMIDCSDFYGDTLDADCIDKEAGCALLRAFLDLYEEEPKAEYLEKAKLAASFVLSWIWMWDVPFNKESPLGKRNFLSSGMSAVSVAHHHLDFYGPYMAYDFLRLHQHSRDEFWKDIAKLLLAASSQLVSSPEDNLYRSEQFYGWQPEQVNHTDWNYLPKQFGTKGKFHTCIAWAAVLTTGAFFDIRDRFQDTFNFRLEKQLVFPEEN